MDGAALSLLEDLYKGLARQGPGDDASTRSALRFVGSLGPEARIADIGCGTGAQTMVLASELAGRIVAVDFLQGFLAELEGKIVRAGAGEQVKTLLCSMESLPFKDAELDLIWSEGAVYNMGFRRGLAEWRRFLKKGGCLVLTEISWFTRERPAELEAYWTAEYPEMDTVAGKIAAAEEFGYVPTTHFLLPPHCWTANFYAPLAAAEEAFLKRHPDDPAARAIVDENRRERELYERFGSFYGYAFYVFRKTG